MAAGYVRPSHNKYLESLYFGIRYILVLGFFPQINSAPIHAGIVNVMDANLLLALKISMFFFLPYCQANVWFIMRGGAETGGLGGSSHVDSI